MLIKNQELIGVVSAVGINGEGIIKEEEFVIFLPFAFLGEKVRYKILKVKKNIAFAKLIEVIIPSPDRIEPLCPVFYKCGGCQLQHLEYNAQLKLKAKNIKDCFKKIAGIDISDIDILKSEKIFGYRNKLQLPVTDLNGKTVIGFYSENSHFPIQINDCPITAWSKDIIQAFGEYINKFNIKGYNEQTCSGELRHIVCRGIDDKFIITAVSLTENLRGIDFLIEKLKERFKQFSLYINVNNKNTNVILGEKFILKYGESRYNIRTCSIEHEFGAESFLQVNREVSIKIYEKAIQIALPDKDTTVIDAYSGAGLMTAMFAKKAKKVVGIEIIKEAVECADNLAKINGLENKMQNICGKCEEILPEIIKKLKSKGEKTVLVLDPPRKGVEQEVINSVIESKVEKIIYISCNPSTLARDIGLLTGALRYTEKGTEKSENINRYTIEHISGYDMFPQTKHVETIISLVLNHKKD